MVALFYFIYSYFYSISLFKIQNSWPELIVLNILIDFIFYWSHRWGHSNGTLWAAHAPHHSSEEMNYTVGLRSGILQRLFYFPLLIPLVWLGFSPEIVLATVAGQHILQLLSHTRVIKNFGWFDIVLNSPAHHRVHHARNPQYRDKNFAGLLIIWDKIFGTYVDETVPCEYGVGQNLQSHSPVEINFQYWNLMLQKCVGAKKIFEKILVWFKATDWLPEGAKPWVKVPKPMEVKVGSTLRFYIFIQLPVMFYSMLQVTTKNNNLVASERILLAGLIWASLISVSRIIDGKKVYKIIDLIRFVSLSMASYLLTSDSSQALYFLMFSGVCLLFMIYALSVDESKISFSFPVQKN